MMESLKTLLSRQQKVNGRINLRISHLIGGRPILPGLLDRPPQCWRKRSRCQRTTVSGSAMSRACRQLLRAADVMQDFPGQRQDDLFRTAKPGETDSEALHALSL